MKRNNKGQAITEYAAVIAFVAILIALLFNIAKGSMTTSVSSSFSSVVKQVNRVNGLSHVSPNARN
jgi:Flp pilus assembly pilin Flp